MPGVMILAVTGFFCWADIDSDRSTKMPAKPPSTHGFCRAADSSVPVMPAATPAAA